MVPDHRDNSLNRDWAAATETVVKNCMVEPFPLAEKLNFEDNREREYSRTAVRVYFPWGTDVVHTDRLLINGHSYDVFGHPGKWYGFDGHENHIAAIGRIREG